MGIRKYQLENAPYKHLTGKLIYVTSSQYEGDWKSIPHSHYFVELFYVKSGYGQFVIENHIIPISRDELIIVNPNVEHTEISLGDPPLEYIALGVEDFQFSFRQKADYLVLNCQSGLKNLGSYFFSILNEVEKKAPGYELASQNLLEILTIQLMRQTDSAFDIAPVRNTSRECDRIKRYLDSNFQDDISLDSLAEMAHLNKYYFVHAFTKFYGQSPMNYLTMRRIQTSKDLLLSTDYSISQIAQLSGFSSPSYFSQCFRRQCGITAAEFRRTRGKNE